MARVEPYYNTQGLRFKIRAQADEIERLRLQLDEMYVEQGRLIDLIIVPFEPVSCDVHHRMDSIDQKMVTTFRFPKPDPHCIAEHYHRFLEKNDLVGREKWLKRCRWQLARRWAKHALQTFDQAVGEPRL